MENNLASSPIPRTEDRAFAPVAELCEKAVEDGVFPGAVLLVATPKGIVFHRSFGFKTVKSSKMAEPPRMELGTVFDVASVTQLVATTTLLMKLFEEGKFKLSDRITRYEQGFGVHGKSPITIGQVLSHCSGLPAWEPFFQELLDAQSGARRGVVTSRGARDYIYNTISRMELKYQPSSKQVYSDIGFMLLGHVIELLTGVSLDKAAQRWVFQPLGLKSTSYVDLSMIKRRGIHPVTDVIAPTEECSWRKRVLCGEVHDDNAWVMGGIAGHSGIFSTAADLHQFCAELLRCSRGRGTLLKEATIASFWDGPASFPEGYRFGWDSPGKENGMSESGLSLRAVGQNAFTGCSVWLEPQEGIEIIFMSNRIHPSRANKKIGSFRPELHSLILKSLKG